MRVLHMGITSSTMTKAFENSYLSWRLALSVLWSGSTMKHLVSSEKKQRKDYVRVGYLLCAVLRTC